MVDTTNNRLVVKDGTTAGGWPAAKLAEVITNTRTAVSDAAYTAVTTPRLIAYTAITAPRIVALPASQPFRPERIDPRRRDRGLLVDQYDFGHAQRHGHINGVATTPIQIGSPYAYVRLESNQAGSGR